MKYLAVFLGANLLLAQSTAVPEAEPLKKPPLAAPAAAPNVKAPTSKEAAKSEPAGVPGDKRAKGEALRFTVNWPSGLSLGEAELTSSPGDSSQSFSFHMDVSIPGFAVSESAKSRATLEYCSIELAKDGTRGKRKLAERTEFDSSKMTATRTTEGGGKSEVSLSACAKDALTFVYFLRRELAAGRLPAQQKIYYGGAYSVRVTFGGTQRIAVGGEQIEADKITATVKGPVTETMADLFFAKDATRTPLLIQVPLAMGKFSMELVR